MKGLLNAANFKIFSYQDSIGINIILFHGEPSTQLMLTICIVDYKNILRLTIYPLHAYGTIMTDKYLTFDIGPYLNLFVDNSSYNDDRVAHFNPVEESMNTAAIGGLVTPISQNTQRNVEELVNGMLTNPTQNQSHARKEFT